ncbi:hypothetical protein D3C71_2027030 [compost metagenome]
MLENGRKRCFGGQQPHQQLIQVQPAEQRIAMQPGGDAVAVHAADILQLAAPPQL